MQLLLFFIWNLVLCYISEQRELKATIIFTTWNSSLMAVRTHRCLLCTKKPCACATWHSASVTPISRLHLRVSGLSKWLFSMTIIVHLYWAVRPGTVLSTLHSHVSSSWQPSELGAVVFSIFQLGETEGRGGYVPCPRSSSRGSGIAGHSLRCGWLHRRGTTLHACFHLNWPPCLCLDPTGMRKQQEQPVEEMLEELRAKLKWTQGELEAQREAERQRQLQVGLERKRRGDLLVDCPGDPWGPRLPQDQKSGWFPAAGSQRQGGISWVWKVILHCQGREIQLFFQICMANRRAEHCTFLHYSAPHEGIWTSMLASYTTLPVCFFENKDWINSKVRSRGRS